jgi:hypothetical protein
MDINKMIIASVQGLMEARHRREQECHIPHDLESDLTLMAKYYTEIRKNMFATNVTIQLEPGMKLRRILSEKEGTMNQQEVEAIYRRWNASSKGPWTTHEQLGVPYTGKHCVIAETPLSDPRAPAVRNFILAPQNYSNWIGQPHADAEFISQAWADIQGLLAERKHLLTLLKEAHAVLTNAHICNDELIQDVANAILRNEE